MILDVLQHYGLEDEIRTVGRFGWRSVRCPFHGDERASASFSLELNSFRCHGCPVKGDAVKIVMSQEGLPDRASAEQFIETELGVSSKPVRKQPKPGRKVPGRTKDLVGGRPPLPSRRG